MKNFEWDDQKSERNQLKHGISFSQATELWNGPHVEVKDIARSSDGESRSATLGMYLGKVYVAIWVYRGEKIRLISVRRARDGEENIYYKKILQDL